jgi:hypothetical protein
MTCVTLQCAPRHSLLGSSVLTLTRKLNPTALASAGFPMSAMSQQQSPAQTWKRRQRRQRIMVAVIVVVLLAALAYGWLHVFGIF